MLLHSLGAMIGLLGIGWVVFAEMVVDGSWRSCLLQTIANNVRDFHSGNTDFEATSGFMGYQYL